MLINKSSRQLSQVYKVVLFVISIVFALFLLQAGSLIIENLPTVGVKLSLNDYINKKEDDEIDNKISQLLNDLDILTIEKNSLITSQNSVEKNYQLEKEKYESYLASRYVTEDSSDNKNVEDARKELDRQRQQLKKIKSGLSAQEVKITETNNKLSGYRLKKEQIHNEAIKLKTASEDINTLKAFALRLLFVLPLLLLAAYLFIKYRKSNYWPFVYGWIYFSTYAFFVELVPYLPSYGGYVRSAVGIILCFIIGKFTIRKLNHYIEQKQKLETENEGERRSRLQNKEANLELAFEKITRHLCPSCDRKFIKNETKFCSFCGLCIQKNCPSCSTLQISFNQYCHECGAKQESGS